MSNYELETRNNIKEAIIRVIVFFDLFDYPLTANELWNYLDKKYSLLKIVDALAADTMIEQKNGLYFLAGREEILIIRQRRHNYSIRKIKIANHFSRFFRLLPFIKLIAVANSIGQYNLRDGSDIDFFIITSPRRIWLTRFICAGMAKILNRRPTDTNKRDKICLSFYITEENLNLDELQLSAGDPYFFFWLRSLVLLYNKDNLYEKFLAANKLSPVNSFPDSPEKLPEKIHRPARFGLDYLESLAKKIQLIIMSPALKKAMNKSAGVVINDKILKFYLKDNRQLFAEKYGNKIRQIFTENN